LIHFYKRKMADKHAVLELGEDDLQFSSHDYTTPGSTSGTQNSAPPPSQPSSATDDAGEPQAGGTTSNFWSLSYYQQCFDVEDKDVLSRLLYSMLPIPGKSFLQHHIRPKPDLYGPFWICVTLIFSIAISGNLADYLSSSLQGQATWHYDFHKVTLASTAVFSYAGLIPACLYGYLWWAGSGQGGTITISFIELLCLYGYSVTIYIPISILWLLCVKVGWLQWVLVLVGASLSGAVLFTTVWPAIRENAAKSSGIIIIIILGLHFLLAAGFMMYFFHSGASASSELVPAPQDDNQNMNQTLPNPSALKQVDIDGLSTASSARVEKNVDPGIDPLIQSSPILQDHKSSANPQSDMEPKTGSKPGEDTAGVAAVEGSDSAVEGSDSAVEGSDSAAEVSNSAAEGSNSAVEGSDSAVKESDSAVEQVNSTVKDTKTTDDKKTDAEKADDDSKMLTSETADDAKTSQAPVAESEASATKKEVKN
jgi:hypothetical protein